MRPNIEQLESRVRQEVANGARALRKWWWVRKLFRQITCVRTIRQYVPDDNDLQPYIGFTDPSLEFYNELRQRIKDVCADELRQLRLPHDEYKVFVYLYPRSDVDISITVARHEPSIPPTVETIPVSG